MRVLSTISDKVEHSLDNTKLEVKEKKKKTNY